MGRLNQRARRRRARWRYSSSCRRWRRPLAARPPGGAHDHDERGEPGAGGGRRPRVLLPARAPRTRRASRSSAAGRGPGSRTRRAGSSTPACPAARSPRSDPRGLVFTPLARSAVCLVTQPRQPACRTSPARSCRTSSPAAIDDLGAGARGGAGRDAIARVAFDPTSAARSVFVSTFVDLARRSRPPRHVHRLRAGPRLHRGHARGVRATWTSSSPARLHAVPYEGVPCSTRDPGRRHLPGAPHARLRHRGPPAGRAGPVPEVGAHRRHGPRVIATRYVVP